MDKKEKCRMIRIQRAKSWLKDKEGSEVAIIHAYKKRYKVDLFKAFDDLQLAGYHFTPEYCKNMQDFQEYNRLKKGNSNDNEDSDETFAFIAGYTSGGAAFGTTWEELGLDANASEDELEKAYQK